MKQIISLVFIFFMLLQVSWSQENSNEIVYSLVVKGGIGINDRLLNTSEQYQWVVNQKNDLETFKISAKSSLIFERKIPHTISFGVGLCYADMGYQSKKTEALWAGPGYIREYELRRITNFRFTSFQYYFDYYLPYGNRNFFLHFSYQAMGKSSFYNKEKLYWNGQVSKESEHSLYPDGSLLKKGITLGFGWEKMLHKNFSLSLSPTFSYVFDNYNEPYYYTHLYSFDLNLGLKWHYKRKQQAKELSSKEIVKRIRKMLTE